MADSTMKLSLQKNEKELNILERRMDQFQESMERNFEQSSAQIAAMGNQIIQLSQKLQTTSEEVAQKIIEAINAFRRSEKEKLTPSEVSCDQSSEVPAMQDYSVPFSGGDPCEFIRGYEEFFKLNPMTEIDMIQYVMQDFEGEALEWYYKYVEENFLDTWTPDCWGDFVAEIYRKFSELKTMLPYDEEIEAAADLTEVGDCNVFQTEIENLNQNQQVFNQLDHLKVNSLPRYDSSFPNLAANIEAGVLFANKKEMGVEGKVFDKNPEPSDYTNALNLKPPDGYDIRRKTMKEVDNGVEVKGGEPLIVKLGAEMTLHLSQACPGEVKKGKGLESICLFVNVEGKKLVLGTLSPEKLPQQLDLVFDRDFEPTHNWKNESVFVYGYKVDKSNDETGNEDEYESESEEDFPRIAANNGKPPAQVKQEKLIADEKVNAVKDSAVVLGGSEFSLVVIDEVESFALIFDPGGGIISTSSYFRLDHNSHALNSLIFMLIDMGVVCCYNTVHCLSKLGLMGCPRENFTEMINAKSSVVFFVPTNVDVQVKFISKGTHENWNLIIASFDEIIYDLISNEEKSLSTVGILLQSKLEYRNCALGVLIRVTDKTLWDLSSNFIFIENDVGKNRTLASVPKLQELNYVVVVSTLTTTLTKVQLSDFQAVVFTDIDLENAIAFNDYCHNHQPSIAFIKTEVSSLFGNVLCDFGPEFTVVDVDGEERHTGMIASISNDKPALVSCVYDEGLEFQDGDLLVFSKVRGMAKLNAGKSRKVINTRPYSFSLEEDILNFGPYERGGRFPVAGSEKDAQKLISIASNIYESFGDAKLSNLNPKCLRHFPFGVWAVLNPMAAMFGGIIGQEVMTAYSEKFHPLFQFFYFDSVESLPAKPLEPSDFKPLNSRYVAQILVFWPKLLEYAQVFVVRSGALVCEFLKKLALMGVSYNNLITLLCAILFTSGEDGRTCVEQLLHLLGQIDQYVSLSVEYQRRRGCLAGNEMLLKFHTLGVAGYCSRGCLGSCTHNKKVDHYLHRISNLPSAFTLPSRNALCLGDRIVVCLPHCADTISEVRKVYAQIVDQLFTMQTLILGVKDLFKDWGIVKNWEQGKEERAVIRTTPINAPKTQCIT